MGNIIKFAQQMQLKDYCYVNPLVSNFLGNDYYSVETKEGEIKTAVFINNNAVVETVEKIENLQKKGSISDCWIVFEYALPNEVITEIRNRFSVCCEQRIIPIFWTEENEKFYDTLIGVETVDAETSWEEAWKNLKNSKSK